MSSKTLNVPNTLSLIRVILVPAFVVSLLAMRGIAIWGQVVPMIIYIVTGLTDMLDGKIARKYNLVTDFGKFIDPLADKFMVLSSLITINLVMIMDGAVTEAIVFVAVVLIILFRELAVTSLRLVVANASSKKPELSANMFGKLKTVSQMVGTVVLILEPILKNVSATFYETHIIAYVFMAIMTVMTVGSGINYWNAYAPYIDTNAKTNVAKTDANRH